MLNFKSFQSVSLIGRLGADAQLSKTKSGTPMLSLSVATSESVKNAEGHYDQKTVWHKPVFFGARAEKVASTLVKGTLLSIQAHLSYREVTLEGGKKANLTSIIVDDFQILSSPKSDAAASGHSKAPAAKKAPASAPYDNATGDYDDMAF